MNEQTQRMEGWGEAARDTAKQQADAVTSRLDANTASLQQQRDYYAQLQDQRKQETESAYDKMRQYLDTSAQLRDQRAQFGDADRSALQQLGDRVARMADDARRGAAEWVGISLPPTPTPEMAVLADVLRAPAHEFADYGMGTAKEWVADKLGVRDVYDAGREVKGALYDPVMHFQAQVETARDWGSFISRNAAGQTSPDENLDRSIEVIKTVGDHAFGPGLANQFARGMTSIGTDYIVSQYRYGMRNLETAFAEFDRQVGSSGSTYSSSWNWNTTSYARVRSVYVPVASYPLPQGGVINAPDDQEEPDNVTADYDDFFSFLDHH